MRCVAGLLGLMLFVTPAAASPVLSFDPNRAISFWASEDDAAAREVLSAGALTALRRGGASVRALPSPFALSAAIWSAEGDGRAALRGFAARFFVPGLSDDRDFFGPIFDGVRARAGSPGLGGMTGFLLAAQSSDVQTTPEPAAAVSDAGGAAAMVDFVIESDGSIAPAVASSSDLATDAAGSASLSTPLPASAPLFLAAILGAAFAARRRGRV